VRWLNWPPSDSKRILPELIEDKQANNSSHVGMTRPRLQTDGDVTSAGVDDALSQYCTKLGHHILVLVTDHLHTATNRFNNLDK